MQTVIIESEHEKIRLNKHADGDIELWQGGDQVLVVPSALPALISALQAAMQDTPTTDRGEE